MSCKSMKQDEDNQNYKKETTLVVGKNPNGNSRMNKKPDQASRFMREYRFATAIALASAITVVLMTDARGQSVASANARFSWVAGSQSSGNIPDLAFDTKGNVYAICQFNSTNATIGG